MCNHDENEKLKIAPSILATDNKWEDVLQLANRFPAATIEPPRISVCAHTYTLEHKHGTRRHTYPHNLAGLPTDLARKCRPENDFTSLCQQRPPAPLPPSTEVVVGGIKERPLLSFA